jgi:hypothetical protein
MMMLSPLEREINTALESNLSTLKDAFFDLLAALVLCLVAFFSLLHAGLRLLFGFLGLLLWSLALLITFFYWLRSLAVARSSSSLHTQFPTREIHHDEIVDKE